MSLWNKKEPDVPEDKPEKTYRQLVVRMSPELFATLKEASARERRTMSQLAMFALEAYLKKEEK